MSASSAVAWLTCAVLWGASVSISGFAQGRGSSDAPAQTEKPRAPAIAQPSGTSREGQTSAAQGPGTTRDTPVSTTTPVVYVATVDSVIHPIAAEFIDNAIGAADTNGAAAIVFTLETPGGLLESTRTIISRIVSARTPVVVFVGPGAARAASAGFLITLAADVAVMAPAAHIGAAHPVAGGGEKMDETMEKKAASDVAAYARSLAHARRRNVTLADQAVLQSRAFIADEALHVDPPLIDFIATDIADLLRQLDGRTITRFDGRQATLHTAGARLDPLEMTARQRFLSAIAHPQVAYVLFTLGLLGLTVELWNPGSILPGVAGGLCLLLAFLAFQVLPINAAGLLLIVFGLLLLVLELKIPSFGVLGVGGATSLVLGAIVMMNRSADIQVGLQLIIPPMVALAAIFLFLGRLALNAQRRPALTGPSAMIGEHGRALTPIPAGGVGHVAAHGEIWTAHASEPIAAEAPIRIVGVEGLVLTVERADRLSYHVPIDERAARTEPHSADTHNAGSTLALSAPERSTADNTAPDGSHVERATRDSTTPDRSTPDHRTPDRRTPDRPPTPGGPTP